MEESVSEAPIYRRIADELLKDIGSGRFPVGTKLPGEHELRGLYGVSRHTIREALRLLEEHGLISRAKGVGTVVVSSEVGQAYVQSLRSVDDILQYPADTAFVPSEETEELVDALLSRRLGIGQGTQWARFGGLRRRTDDGQPICWTDVYIPMHFRHVGAGIGQNGRPVYETVVEALGDVVQEIEVDIGAGVLPGPMAAMLGVEAGSPSVSVIRRYIGRDNGLFEVSVSEHPAERFTYSIHLARDC